MGMFLGQRAIFVVLAVFLFGCGSLRREVRRDGLTPDDMAYAQTLHGSTNLTLTGYRHSFSSSRAASYGYFVPPVMFIKTFGSSYNQYAYSDMFCIIPLFCSGDGIIYDSHGVPREKISLVALSFLGGIASSESSAGRSSALHVFTLPLVGSMFVFGDQQQTFFWIPVRTPRPQQE